MKIGLCLLFVMSSVALASTEERTNRTFSVASGGTLTVDVTFGAIEVTTNTSATVTVDVWRKVTRKDKAEEEKFFQTNPVEFQQEGDTILVRSKVREKHRSFAGDQTEGKYTIQVPAQFNLKLNTAGGGISVAEVTGMVKTDTSGGGLRFARVHGPLTGNTSGGGIHVADCEGAVRIETSGGGIEVGGGSGSLEAETSGGPIQVHDFHGDAHVTTTGGGITIENVTGKIDGTTTGGGVKATLVFPLVQPVELTSTGGGITVRVPGDAAFNLDAATSGGGASSALPVVVTGKMSHDHLAGTVNGGGVTVRLRSTGGGISIKKL